MNFQRKTLAAAACLLILTSGIVAYVVHAQGMFDNIPPEATKITTNPTDKITERITNPVFVEALFEDHLDMIVLMRKKCYERAKKVSNSQQLLEVAQAYTEVLNWHPVEPVKDF